MYDASSGLLLKVCCVLVNPSGAVLLLKQQDNNSERADVFALPGSVISREFMYDGVNVRQEIKRSLSDLTKVSVANLATDVFAGTVHERTDSNHSGYYLTFCAGAVSVAQQTIQIDYERHASYRWEHELSLRSEDISVTDTAAACIGSLKQNTQLFQTNLSDQRAW